MQIQNQKNPPKGAFYIVDTAKQVYREGGIKPFFRGFSPTIIRAVPAAAATFTTYELVMRALSGL
jgi:solute carrier family 25 carnitine/acylcarnitine transporter 20/29